MTTSAQLIVAISLAIITIITVGTCTGDDAKPASHPTATCQ